MDLFCLVLLFYIQPICLVAYDLSDWRSLSPPHLLNQTLQTQILSAFLSLDLSLSENEQLGHTWKSIQRIVLSVFIFITFSEIVRESANKDLLGSIIGRSL